MGVLKILVFGVPSLCLLAAGGIYSVYRQEQNQLDQEVDWDEFKTKWNNQNNFKKLKSLEKEIEQMCKGKNNNCSNKQEIINATDRKFDFNSVFKDSLEEFGKLGTSVDEICKSVIKEFKNIRAFCPV